MRRKYAVARARKRKKKMTPYKQAAPKVAIGSVTNPSTILFPHQTTRTHRDQFRPCNMNAPHRTTMTGPPYARTLWKTVIPSRCRPPKASSIDGIKLLRSEMLPATIKIQAMTVIDVGRFNVFEWLTTKLSDRRRKRPVGCNNRQQIT
jgi:hypothetical protein